MAERKRSASESGLLSAVSNAVNTESDSTTRWPLTFQGGIWPVVAFLLAFAVWVMISNVFANAVLGSDPSIILQELWHIPSGVVQAAIVLLVLRYEGVSLRELGLSRRKFVSAIVAIAGFLVALNLVIAGLIVLGGSQLSIGLFEIYTSPPLNWTASVLAASMVGQYVFVAVVEELALRGYLQNKLIALLDTDYSRLNTALGIVAAAVAFSLLHIPTQILLEGVSLSGMVGSLLMLAVTGITFGAIYAATRNLYLVIFLHGIGNLWPLIVDPGISTWPNWVVILVLYVLVVVVYRQWAARGTGSIHEVKR
jgi:membrane protease YdiL (CAAX protease family)